MIALETAGHDATYAWRVERDPTNYAREQIFPEERFEAISPARIHAGIISTLNRLKPDAVAINSYSLPDSRACLAWCRRHHRVAVVMTDSHAGDAPRVAWREHLKARIIAQFDAALVGGTPHRDYMSRLGIPDEYIFLGYDVVDNDFFRTEADRVRRSPQNYCNLPGLELGAPYFLASNRFIPRKNLEGLLHAYAMYRSRANSPWRLLLLGDGPERTRLEQLIERERLKGVVFCGFRQIDELPAYYSFAGAFIHPAYRDQWGLVVNEAMAAGIPVLVSERAGCAHDLVFNGENGFRIDPGDPTRLAERMQQIASPQTDLAAMGRRSQEIIAAWSPKRFAMGLWAALQAGHNRERRPFAAPARLLLWAIRKSARSVVSFHAIEA